MTRPAVILCDTAPELPLAASSAPAFVPSPQQSAVFEWVLNGTGSAFVEAVAGAGKTTTLVGVLKLLRGSVAFVAYNTKIVAEIKARVAKLEKELGVSFANLRVGTFHSFGFQAWRRVHPGVKSGPEAAREKRDMTVKKLVENKVPEGLHGFILKLVSLAKQRAIGLHGSVDDESLWYDIVDHFDLAFEVDDQELIADGVKWAIRALKYHVALAPKIIDFDDMCYMPVVTGCRMWENDWILVDECQPAGTMVEIPIGRVAGGGFATASVPIETLKKSDTVVSFSRKTGCHIVAGKRLTKVKKHHFQGTMHRVTCGNRITSYTPNHWCWASSRDIAGSYLVYVMRKGNRFRIGQCKGKWAVGENRSGLGFRMSEETADALWILSRHDTKAEALIAETMASIDFGIPMTRFVPSQKFSSDYTEGVWKQVKDNREQAFMCLEHHGRSIDYPFMERGQQQERDLTRPVLIRACNLMDGMLMLPFNGGSHHDADDYKPIAVHNTSHDGDVYSLEVEDYEMYVADGITTHNCQDTNPARRALARKLLRPNGRAVFVGDRHQAVYGFQGADADAVDQIVESFNCQLLPLTITYRCPKTVVALAQTIVSHIEAHETAPEGSVRTIEAGEMSRNLVLENLTAADAILCRTTRPLVELAYQFIRSGVACHVEGKDIGMGLLKLVNRWHARDLDDLRDKLEAYQDREVAKLMAKGKETQAEALADRVGTVLAIADNLRTVDEVRQRIVSMFVDGDNEHKPTLTLATAHRSKGREWRRVFILGYHQLMPSRWARQQWQLDQESNLKYVAVTRAQNELVLVNVEA